MNAYTVYTPFGEYRDVAARSERGAMFKIYNLLFGRVSLQQMRAERTA
jgi:hypothetical protein